MTERSICSCVEGERYDVTAFVDNVTDDEYASGWLGDSSLTGVLAVVNPRTSGLRAIRRFQ